MAKPSKTPTKVAPTEDTTATKQPGLTVQQPSTTPDVDTEADLTEAWQAFRKAGKDPEHEFLQFTNRRIIAEREAAEANPKLRGKASTSQAGQTTAPSSSETDAGTGAPSGSYEAETAPAVHTKSRGKKL